MTEEEKEVENAIYYYRPQTDRERKLIELLVEEKIKARLKGLAEGKPKWHDLRKDPQDLPTEKGEYWAKFPDCYNRIYYTPESDVWTRTWVCLKVIAWTEIPVFEE